MPRFRLAILLSHPVQYFSPLFRKLAACPDLDLTVYYGSAAGVDAAFHDEQFGVPVKWDIPLLEGYRSVFLRNQSPRPRLGTHFWGVQNWGIYRQLHRDRPDALLVHGWSYCCYVQGMLAAQALRIPYWLRLETPLNQERLKHGLPSRIKQQATRRLFLRRAARCLPIGSQNRAYYRHCGIPEARLFQAPYCVDNDRFRQTHHQLACDRQVLRMTLGITPRDTVFLFLGKLMPKKRPDDLLVAFEKLAMPQAHLIFVGDGELRSQLESHARERGLNKVHFVGFQNQSEIGKYYTLADVFVLPSGVGETWGLVANEAMNFNLPLIISDLVGCAADLVREGENGFTYPVGDTQALRCTMQQMLDSDRELMGRRSASMVQAYSYDAVVQGIMAAAGVS